MAEALVCCSGMVFVYMFDIYTAYAKAVVPSMGGYFVVVNFLAASLHLGL